MSKRALKRVSDTFHYFPVNFPNTAFQTAKQTSIREKRMLHKKLRAKAKAKQAFAKEVLKSQNPEVKEAVASKPLDKAKSRKAGATAEVRETVKKRHRKTASSKLHFAKQSDASPQRAPEPQKKKRKTQKDHTEISATPQAPLRSQEKPLGKTKAPREKRRNKSEGT